MTTTHAHSICDDLALPEPDLSHVVLSGGSHGGEFTGECCIIELSNRLAACNPVLRERFGKERFSDDHSSIAPTIRRFLIRLNDGWLNEDGTVKRFAPADAQAILKRYALRALGTRTTQADDDARALLAGNWAIREALPQWLDLLGAPEDAATCRAFPEFTSLDAFYAVRPALWAIRDRCWSRRQAAWTRYWEARKVAGGGGAAAAVAAVAVAVAEAEVAAAAAAAVAVAVAEAEVAVVVAEVAVVAVAEVAEVAAAAAAEVAAAAAAAAVAVKWRPTVESLERSALSLLDRMIAIGRPAEPGEGAA